MKGYEVVFKQPNKAELEEFELEKSVGEEELLVKSICSLISAGTEAASFTGLEKEISGSKFSYPIRPGYCNIGEVLAVGENVKDYQIGDTILSIGKHATHVKVNTRRFCLKVPKDLEPTKAVFSRMAAIAITALRTADLSIGDKVLIIGLGLVGNLAAQEFLLAGADVMAVDLSPFRVKRARECGIAQTVNSAEVNLKDAVMNWTEGKGARIAAECVGQSELILQAVELTRKYGEVILLGTPRKKTKIDIMPAFHRIHTQGIMVKGALEWLYPIHEGKFARYPIINNLRQIFGWLQEGSLKTKPLLTHILSPKSCQEAYSGLVKDKDKYLGVIFDWKGWKQK